MATHAQMQARAVRNGGDPSDAGADDVRLSLPARPENIAVIRHVLAAFAEAVKLPDGMIEDLRLAVTEACTNVVRHAYKDGVGAIEISIRPERGGLRVVVADHGHGLGPSPDKRGPGLGLPLIAALADAVEFEHEPAGSRITMSFARRRPEAA